MIGKRFGDQEIFRQGSLARTHPRLKRNGRVTDPETGPVGQMSYVSE